MRYVQLKNEIPYKVMSKDFEERGTRFENKNSYRWKSKRKIL